MSYELISNEEFSTLPVEDDRCFVEYENICRRNMTRMIDENSSEDFTHAVRSQYMAAVSSVATECNIPNILYDPTSDGNFWQQFHIFSLSVQGEVARIRIRMRGANHPYSVLLTGSTRTKIEHYISRIRDLVARSDMDPDRRRRLDERLDQLVQELGSQRLSFAKTMAILVTITTTIAGVTTIAADGQSAVAHIMQLIGRDKESEDMAARRLTPPPKALPAPQKLPVHQKPVLSRPASQLLDDDVPF